MTNGLVYDTTLEISMNALIHNLNYYRSLLKPTTKIMVMVKAFSYGLGTYEVAKVLEENKVDYLGVANIYEGMELRKAGIGLPIMIMKPEIDSFDLVMSNQLTPTIFSFKALNALLREVERVSLNEQKEYITISIKFDTGMRRLGFEENQVSEIINKLKQSPRLRVESIYSHLAASGDVSEDDFSRSQIEQFTRIYNRFKEEFPYSIDGHILNSTGIERFKEAQFDMVRLGIGLYGGISDSLCEGGLMTIGTLRSKIAQLKEIKKGDTVGYGRKGRVKSNSKIATIPVGYADGLDRMLGNGQWEMMVQGERAPIIGDVCMDMVMIDVTGINCKEGDEVIVFGKENSIINMAEKINTIPYEVLTSYSPRVKREFVYS